MSAIPPHAVGSVLQSGMAQQVQSAARDSEENLRGDASRELTGKGGSEDVIEIEETDSQTKVDAEGGGQGSQGRHDAPPEEDDAAGDNKPRGGVTYDDDGTPHLDISA